MAKSFFPLREMTLILDDDDFRTIQREIARRQLSRWPDAEGGTILPEGDSNLAGAILAECIRDLDDYRTSLDSRTSPDSQET